MKAELKTKNAALSALRSAPTTDSLREAVQVLQAKRAESEQRLKVLKSGSIKPVSDAEREEAEKEHRKWKRCREARKRAFRELEGMLLDSGVMSKEDLWVWAPGCG